MPRRMRHPSTDVPDVSSRRLPSFPAVVLAVAALAVVAVSVVVRDAVSSLPWLVAVVVLAASWWVLRRRTRGIGETSAEHLDERDVAIRNVAAWWGQTTMFSLSAVAALMLIVSSRLDAAFSNTLLLRGGGILLSFVILSAAVPTFVVSLLIEPDEHFGLDDDEDEE